MTKITLILLVCTITLSSCAQQNTDQNNNTKELKNEKRKIMIPIPEQSKDITVDNYVDRMVAQVQHYDKEPMYFLRPSQNSCVYEILVNDYPVYKNYRTGQLGTPIEINHAILQSGTQTVTVRLYPLGDLMERNYGKEGYISTLLNNTRMIMRVVKYEAYNISDELEDEITVIKHTSPTKEGTNEFIGAGLPYYEYSFTFEAEVPYINKGWTDGQDLTKFDKEELEKQTLQCYNDYIYIYKNQDINSLLKLYYLSETRVQQSEYHDKEKIKRILNERKKSLEFKNKEFQPVKDYIMNFYGNNRIVALKHPSKEPVDRRLRGRSAFWFLYNNGEGRRVRFSEIYLYLPKGQPLDSLQLIP
jgi:hypothetical protein